MSQESYAARGSRLLKGFDRSVSRVKDSLITRYGEPTADALTRDSRRAYERLIPRIPYIGDANPLLIFLLPATRYLAVYQAFRDHGRTLEEAGRLVCEIGEAEIQAIPGWVRGALGIAWFSKWFRRRLQKRAASSLERRYPGDYVLAYVEGDGRDFDYGIDYLECASCKLLAEHGASELAPYVCAVDKVAGEMLGWGLRRTTTLAEGGDRCDFRFKRGRATSVTIPDSLRSTGQ